MSFPAGPRHVSMFNLELFYCEVFRGEKINNQIILQVLRIIILIFLKLASDIWKDTSLGEPLIELTRKHNCLRRDSARDCSTALQIFSSNR